MKIPFSPPDITEREAEEVRQALLSGWITTGPRTKQLEREVAQRCQTGRAVCMNSATACLESTLRLLGIGPGDEVIVPAYTYTATASPACHVGARLVMIDSQEGDYEMDYDRLADAINERTKAVIPVDLGGVPCDYERMQAIVDSKRHLYRPANPLQEAVGHLPVIADGAHSFGAAWHGQAVGSVADFTSFSFHAVKNFTTAEGGALTWRQLPGIDDEDIYRQLQLISLHGQSKDALAKTQLGAWEYDIVSPAYKCNMTDIMAAIGLVQMERYDGLLARRRELIGRYDEALKDSPVETRRHYTADYTSSGHLYQVRLTGRTADDRNAVITEMARREIACNVHYKPLPMMTAYKRMGFDIADYPQARRLFENEITLPLHTLLTDEQVEFLLKNFKDVIR